MSNHTTPAPTFQIGRTYECRSSCDYDTIFRWTVVKRTAKFITVIDHLDDSEKRVGVKADDRGEWALPDGSYSMAPVIRAERERVA